VFGACDVAELGSDVSFGRLHGLYWVVANLADRRPLVLAVDDAHWADAPSMRFLGVLSRRLEGLPVLLAVAARPGEPGAEQDVLDDLAAGPAARLLTPRPLSPVGVARVLSRVLDGDPDEAFVAAAADATGGSPLLVRELVRTVEEQRFSGTRDEVAALRQALPGNVGRIVTARLRRLSPDALALAARSRSSGTGPGPPTRRRSRVCPRRARRRRGSRWRGPASCAPTSWASCIPSSARASTPTCSAGCGGIGIGAPRACGRTPARTPTSSPPT
jgi:hypothetical protein